MSGCTADVARVHANIVDRDGRACIYKGKAAKCTQVKDVMMAIALGRRHIYVHACMHTYTHAGTRVYNGVAVAAQDTAVATIIWISKLAKTSGTHQPPYQRLTDYMYFLTEIEIDPPL